MGVGLMTLLPSLRTSIDGLGFLFGSGTSLEAGYPMMFQLTRSVVQKLTVSERQILDAVLSSTSEVYDDLAATPNIEELADRVIAYYINTGHKRVSALETKLKQLVVKEMLSIRNPIIDNHVRFFEGLKVRSFGRPTTVWLFTTNYDILLEIAASKAGVTIENGFIGSTMRYFDPLSFRYSRGIINGAKFERHNNLTVKLIKLHGSLSWFIENNTVYETHPDAIKHSIDRCLVLPRRKKVIETMKEPFNQLFTINNHVIGNDCRYLLSCGFSFNDEHINNNILLPAIKSNRCTLACLCKEEPVGISCFKPFKSFKCAFPSYSINCIPSNEGTELWQFSHLAEAINI